VSNAPPSQTFRALGTTVVVLTDRADRLEAAVAAARAEIDAVDLACSRFRADSELSRLLDDPGATVEVSPLLAQALTAAFDAAHATDGLVDPTIASSLRAWGYDRDFVTIPAGLPPLTVDLRAVPGWRTVRFDPAARMIRVPPDVELDLGATGKAFAADRSAVAAAAVVGCGVLVSIGGDIAVAGTPPDGGWDIRITDDHAAGPDAEGPVVAISSGGLATSSTTVRRWTRGEVTVHHIIDPRTGGPAEPWWRTVSVAGATCAQANAASTAAVVLGPSAESWLTERGFPARLVHVDGTVATVAGWPADDSDEEPGA
jgi:thiamine biosynthesis lipoprotein